MLVENDEIGADALEPPVLLGLQRLANQRHRVADADAHQEDRQVARDGVGPQSRLRELVGRDRLRARPQRSVGPEHARRQALEEDRFVG